MNASSDRIMRAHILPLILLITLVGCNVSVPTPSQDGSQDSGSAFGASETLVAKSWPLGDGTTLDAKLVSVALGEGVEAASLIIERSYDPSAHSPLDRLSLQFADTPQWIEVPQLEAVESEGRTTQVYELPFSAPLPVTFEVQWVKDGVETETPFSWTITPEDMQ